MPAQAIKTRALRKWSSWSSSRCRPATPTSSTSSQAMPWHCRANWASAATARSLLPPPSTTTRPLWGSASGRGPLVRQRAWRWCTRSWTPWGPLASRAATAAALAGSTRVARPSSEAAWSCSKTRAICSALLCSPQIASTMPRRRRRSRSRRMLGPRGSSPGAGGMVMGSTSKAWCR